VFHRGLQRKRRGVDCEEEGQWFFDSVSCSFWVFLGSSSLFCRGTPAPKTCVPAHRGERRISYVVAEAGAEAGFLCKTSTYPLGMKDNKRDLINQSIKESSGNLSRSWKFSQPFGGLHGESLWPDGRGNN
jgi:hypothetical protein